MLGRLDDARLLLDDNGGGQDQDDLTVLENDWGDLGAREVGGGVGGVHLTLLIAAIRSNGEILIDLEEDSNSVGRGAWARQIATPVFIFEFELYFLDWG